MPARARLSSSSSMTPRATSNPPSGSPVTRCSARAESTSEAVSSPWETSQSPSRARRDDSSLRSALPDDDSATFSWGTASLLGGAVFE